ncbi:MAG: hypothetical protein QM484_13335 [Woeseiaceae bacterium]
MSNLSLEELKKKNPGLYIRCMEVGIAEGIADGISQERARIVALLPNRTNSTIAKLACENVRNGIPFNQTAKAEYWCAQMRENKKAQKQAADSEYVVSCIEKKFGVYRNENDSHH